MGIEQQIEKIFKDEFPEAEIQISRDKDTGQIGGHVIWEGFKGYSQLKRQNTIYGLLRRHMTTSDGKDISLIFTYTPKERSIMEDASTYNS